jgi:lipoate-protein ligase A
MRAAAGIAELVFKVKQDFIAHARVDRGRRSTIQVHGHACGVPYYCIAIIGEGLSNMPLGLVWSDAAPADAIENLRLDEHLLASGNAILRVWESAAECVVLGRSGRPERDVHLEACRREGVAVLRRCSGGGAVLLGKGCLNYSLVVPLAAHPACRDVRYSVCWITSAIALALALPELRVTGHSDLSIRGRKVSGSAQRRSQTAILHHGTLLYDFDVARVELFLKPPVREPIYRAGRSHRDFLGDLPLTVSEIRRRLRAGLC